MEAYFFNFLDKNTTSLTKDEVDQIPLLKKMVDSELKPNFKNNEYYICMDIDKFMMLYNYLFLKIKPKQESVETFKNIYDYFLGTSITNEKLGLKSQNELDLEELCQCFLSGKINIKEFYKKLWNFYLKDTIKAEKKYRGGYIYTSKLLNFSCDVGSEYNLTIAQSFENYKILFQEYIDSTPSKKINY
ncbi:MAG: hypothetical protein CMF62_01325 [Magnetococcales bacterium]|nr:hypothetical protein [Magnetococcales bacterium]MBA42635.1 hypothetical protein [Magnetococcales bacterium]|tara:strand:+ start:5873 stop:6436 length:564 start_codon:yes stop_codon:yes gene_type:complete